MNGFDNETQSWTDSIHIFVHKLLDDRGLAGIVEPSATGSAILVVHLDELSYSIRILISLSFNRALRSTESIFASA